MTEESEKMLHDYALVRGLVHNGEYGQALSELNGANLNASTREQLRKALESREKYAIDRVFGELDARIMQALCWECWKD